MNTQLKVGDRVRVMLPSSGYYFDGTYLENLGGGFHKVIEDEKTAENFGTHIVFEKTNDGKDRIIPLPPTPKWLPIDKDNLPSGVVVARKIPNKEIFSGVLWIDKGYILGYYLGNTGNGIVYGVTHYIPLTDLLQLPIAE